MKYKIKIDAFEGPMDLLLHLIDKAEIDIYDIPINIIAEQFIEYIEDMEEFNLEVTSEFLIMAATLLEIKSKMLLPKKTNTSEDDIEEEEDPREELIKRLIEYKKFKEAAVELKEFESIYTKMFFKPREEFHEEFEEEIELTGLNVDKLFASLNRIIKENKNKIDNLDINFIQREEYTLEACIKDIKEELEVNEKILFNDLFNYTSSIGEIVTYFLSVLELVKMKYINLEQEEDFLDLFIVKRQKRE